MRDKATIEKDIPKEFDINDTFILEGHRNNHELLVLLLEVMLDVRDLLKKPNE